MKILDIKPTDYDTARKRVINFMAWRYATKGYTHVRITTEDKKLVFTVAEVTNLPGTANYELELGGLAYDTDLEGNLCD